jgi:hypothetical protein
MATSLNIHQYKNMILTALLALAIFGSIIFTFNTTLQYHSYTGTGKKCSACEGSSGTGVQEHFDIEWYNHDDATVHQEGDTPEQKRIADAFSHNATGLILPRAQISTEALGYDAHYTDCARKCMNDPLCKAYGFIRSGEGTGLCHKYNNLDIPPINDSVAYSNYVIGYKK